MYVVQCVFAVAVLVALVSVSEGSDGGSSGENATSHGEILLELGKKYNKPLLKFLGRSLIGLEIRRATGLEGQVQNNTDLMLSVIEDLCSRRQCTDWSQWTNCTGNSVGDLSMITRSRTCGIDRDICPSGAGDSANKTETESKLCEVTHVKQCPADFTTTTNGFCLKYYSQSLTNSAAENTCQQSGAHLVNVNSQTKSDDLNAYMAGIGHTNDVWIDGFRSSASSPWQYRHGQSPQSQGFTNWDIKRGHPTSGSSDLCQLDVYRSNRRSWFWWAEGCTYTTQFVCEY